jgi:hypothetical protein
MEPGTQRCFRIWRAMPNGIHFHDRVSLFAYAVNRSTRCWRSRDWAGFRFWYVSQRPAPTRLLRPADLVSGGVTSGLAGQCSGPVLEVRISPRRAAGSRHDHGEAPLGFDHVFDAGGADRQDRRGHR